MDWNTLISFDKELLLAVNGSASLFLDGLVKTLTTAATWIPLYLALFYLVLKNNDSTKKILLIVACAALCVLIAGSLDDLVVKPLVARWRPSRDPEIGILVDTVNGYRGGRYGFFSAHASNTFSIAVFFSLLIRSRLLTFFLIGWSFVNCWTRLYLGVLPRRYSCWFAVRRFRPTPVSVSFIFVSAEIGPQNVSMCRHNTPQQAICVLMLM